MRRFMLIAALLTVLASTTWAQVSPLNNDPFAMAPRQLSMGGAGIAIADDANAWLTNPAGLAHLNIADTTSSFVSDAILSYGSFTETDAPDYYGLTWSGYSPASHIGIGGGITRLAEMGAPKWLGAGVGAQIGKGPFSAGIGLRRTQYVAWGDTIFAAGLMCRFKTVALGARVDNFNRSFSMPAFYNVGLAWRPTSRLLLAVDALDLSNVTDDGPLYNFGGEFAVTPNFALRAGSYDDFDDSHLTLGAGYSCKNWRVDFGYVQGDSSDLWNAGLGVNF